MSSPENENSSDAPVKIVLSARDAQIFLDALENPGEPNEALIKALREYRARRGLIIDSK